MRRVFVGKMNEDGTIDDPAVVRRLVRVLRIKEGETFAGFDGRNERTLRALAVEKRRVLTEEVAARPGRAQGASLTVGLALLKARGWTFALQKLTELGADRLAPFRAERSVVRPPDEGKGKADRWREIVRAAAAQCGGMEPETLPLGTLEETLRACADCDAKLVLTADGESAAMKDWAEGFKGGAGGGIPSCALLVGPEGDFTPGELERAASAGFTPVHLGSRILRAETAALVGAALALHELGALRAPE